MVEQGSDKHFLTEMFLIQGPFDAVFFNAVFGNVYDQRDTLLRAALLLRPGAPHATPFYA